MRKLSGSEVSIAIDCGNAWNMPSRDMSCASSTSTGTASGATADGSLALVTTFDCLHDMTDPAGMMRTIRHALADDGAWLLVDIKAYDTFAENVGHNPVAAMMYGTSVLSCMASAPSEPGGAGLGTLGLSASRAEAMAREAGFSRFRRLDVDHVVNAFYEIRP